MAKEAYTPGHASNATDFMAQRSLESHGGFFAGYLEQGLTVLDCGCGPGSITLGIARKVAPGRVIGIDFGPSQIERANRAAQEAGLANVQFVPASCYALSFPDGTFDRVFSHALVEHLAEPAKAFSEFHRVLKPGGYVGVCSPDWDGFILAPPSPDLAAAITAYRNLQGANGGDVAAGKKFGGYLAGTGFTSIQMHARYECYPDRAFIGEYLALQLQQQGQPLHAEVLRRWSKQADG
ncbi:MAG TPA: methyltransferase domain-containing protein, partial [Opitutaceae bacterium]|nr:methyltransferase domain-containing protein [Opitutaceae bacterium]